jgi:hypothetical protein
MLLEYPIRDWSFTYACNVPYRPAGYRLLAFNHFEKVSSTPVLFNFFKAIQHSKYGKE